MVQDILRIIDMIKRILILLTLLWVFSCDNNEEFVSFDGLQKRVILLESFDSQITTFVSDSIIEYYENRLIVRKDHYYKLAINAPFTALFQTYQYDRQNNLLKQIKSYNDFSLSDFYAISDYYYNEDNNITKISYDKFNPSNISSQLNNITTHFEYEENNIEKYSIDHLDNDSREDLKSYVVYGNIDSVKVDDKWMYIFDNQNDISNINCVNDCLEYANSKYTYKTTRESIITNSYGNDLNTFLLGSPVKYNGMEVARKYMDEVSSFYPNIQRNGNYKKFNYVFDEDNRLIEVFTTGSSVTNDIIKYD